MMKVFDDVISLEQVTFPFVGPNPCQEKSSNITPQKPVIYGIIMVVTLKLHSQVWENFSQLKAL